MKLEITNRILCDSEYQKLLLLLSDFEKDRVFCRHDMEHFLNVARICCLLCEKKKMCVNTDIIYSAALLHDIGRTVEYASGESHHIAGKSISERILERTGCSDEFRQTVIGLIADHREYDLKDSSLKSIFSLADKKSRLCFMCDARNECYWPDEKKNMDIEV